MFGNLVRIQIHLPCSSVRPGQNLKIDLEGYECLCNLRQDIYITFCFRRTFFDRCRKALNAHHDALEIEVNSKPHISKDATEKTMAWTTAGSRSGMGGYELHDQLSEQFFRPAGGYLANFSSSVSRISEETYSQQAVYLSYTSGLWNHTLIATYSEFGRRVAENGSQGTDHGTAAPMLLAGGKVAGGFIGKQPSLDDLDKGNLRYSIDFKDVYSNISNEYLGVHFENVESKFILFS